MVRTLWTAVLALALCQTADAGPIFSLVGQNSTSLPHPTGAGTRAASHSWGFLTTGAGFLDGTLTFVDGFALPATPGASVAFTAGDLSSLVYRHVENALPSGGTIEPRFAFTAGAGDFGAVSGSVFNHGGGLFTLVFPDVETTVAGSLFRLPGGTINGNYFISGDTVGLVSGGTRYSTITNSEYKGSWRLTGRTAPPDPVPEPATLILLAGALVVIAARRPRRQSARA